MSQGSEVVRNALDAIRLRAREFIRSAGGVVVRPVRYCEVCGDVVPIYRTSVIHGSMRGTITRCLNNHEIEAAWH